MINCCSFSRLSSSISSLFLADFALPAAGDDLAAAGPLEIGALVVAPAGLAVVADFVAAGGFRSDTTFRGPTAPPFCLVGF